jgi:long-chain acyl-CoA synthetase
LRHWLIIGESESDGFSNIYEAIAGADERDGHVDRADDDMAFLLYTSGTTGQPKGVMLSHSNIVSNHTALAQFKRMEERSSTLLCLPLSHAFGVMIMNLCSIFGATASIHRKFDTAEILEAIERYKVTRFSAVPTMLVRLINAPERERFDTSSLEVINSGGAILPNDVRLKFEELYQCKILDGYGMSESAPTACSYHASESLRPGSVGHPIPGVKVSIQNESGIELPPGELGEICIQGPNVMMGYLKDEDASRHALRGSWLHSEDIGYLDEDGYLFLTDRIKDLIIKGGENISPREIEESLYEHPAVAEVSVVGVPSNTYGEGICAVIAFAPGQKTDEESLREHLSKFITKFKIPSRFEFREELPKNANGKIDRKRLRKEVASSAVA